MPDTLYFTVTLTTTFEATVSLETPRRYDVSLRTIATHRVCIR